MSERKRRFILPGALIAAGLAGFGLAAASELGLDWGGKFQAGAVVVDADCQTKGDRIGVAFANPDFDANATIPWSVDAVTFSNISTACEDANYEIVARTGEGSAWTRLGIGEVAGTTLSVDLTENVTAANITNLALTMHKPVTAG